MNETEMLELGAALARTADVLRPGMTVPFRDYVRVALADLGVEIETLFAPGASYLVSVDGQLVDGPESRLPVTAASRVVLYRRQGPMLEVLNRGVARRICLN
jgi:hypothetical protein